MKKLGILVAIFFVLAMVLPAWALEIALEPDNAQREIGGKVRVHIYADGAVNLVSMGVKVSFDNTVLEVTEASKYEENSSTGWVMNDDETPPNEYRTPTIETLAEINANGELTMVGGNLNGSSTTGLSGKVLLGWIVFKAITNGNSDIHVELGRENPNAGETYNNFVRLGGTVDEPTNVPGDLGIICVVDNACYADVDGDSDVDMMDTFKFKQASPSSFGASNYNPAADFDADGDVDMMDIFKFKNGSPRSDCPSCP